MQDKSLRGGGQPLESKKAFTLAETLITLTILGVVAAITVPSLINKYIESSNRTKVKKSMAAYEKALNQMIIENDLKDGEAISAFNGAINNGVNALDCANTRPYFKAIEGVTDNNCRFKTADRVWWDITDIQHPIIALNDDYKNATLLGNGVDTLESLAKSDDNKDVFGMVGTIDNGVVRINDKGVAEGDDATLLNKMYAFINNEKETAKQNEVIEYGEPEFSYSYGKFECDDGDEAPYSCWRTITITSSNGQTTTLNQQCLNNSTDGDGGCDEPDNIPLGEFKQIPTNNSGNWNSYTCDIDECYKIAEHTENNGISKTCNLGVGYCSYDKKAEFDDTILGIGTVHLTCLNTICNGETTVDGITYTVNFDTSHIAQAIAATANTTTASGKSVEIDCPDQDLAPDLCSIYVEDERKDCSDYSSIKECLDNL